MATINVLSLRTASMQLPNSFPTFPVYDQLLGSSSPNKLSMSACMRFCQAGFKARDIIARKSVEPEVSWPATKDVN